MAIHFLHDFRYWTEYLHPYLDPARFSLLRSQRADSSYPAPRLDPKNLAHQDLVLAGHSNEAFAPHTRVLARVQHSPGFGGEAFLHAYRWIHGSPRRMMIPGNVLALLRKTSRLAPHQLVLRDQLVANPKLLTTDCDPSLNHLYRSPRTSTREPGTLLVALNWRITGGPAELEHGLFVIKLLAKSLSVRIIAHPFSPARWVGSRLHEQLLASCRELSLPIAVGVSRAELLREFDRAEYILSDGSGSVYEAVARGCKALLLDGLSYQRGAGVLAAARSGGYLPPTRAAEIDSHPGAAADLAWLRRLHPHSIVDASVGELAAAEIERVFADW